MPNGHDKASTRPLQVENIFLAELKAIRHTLSEMLSVMKSSTAGPDKQTMAIALLAEVGPVMSVIAERIGVNRSTLYRSPQFREFRAAFEQYVLFAEQDAANRQKGHYNADGDIDGVV